jgi:hypothetical protein
VTGGWSFLTLLTEGEIDAAVDPFREREAPTGIEPV